TGTGRVWERAGSNVTLTLGPNPIEVTYSGAAARDIFTSNALPYPDFDIIAGSGTFAIFGAYGGLDFTGFTGTLDNGGSGPTAVSKWFIFPSGASIGNLGDMN